LRMENRGLKMEEKKNGRTFSGRPFGEFQI